MKNKENTKRKLLDAIGNIIMNDGFSGLGVNRIAKSAGVSKILIYRYFGGFSEILRAYVLEKDFWKNCPEDKTNEEAGHLSVREQVCRVLAEQFNNFYNHCEMEAMLVNEISNSNAAVKNIVREESLTAPHTYYKVVSILLLAGTEHLILAEQKADNGHRLEMSSSRKTELLQSIGQIVEWTLA